MFSFIELGFLDILDIAVVAFILYKLYGMTRGTPALTILKGIVVLYILWLLVRSLNMDLTSSVLGQIMGVGILALIIVFQPEIRRFLLYVGSQYAAHKRFSLQRFLSSNSHNPGHKEIAQIAEACGQMAESKTGALIVIAQRNALESIYSSGTPIDAAINSRLLQNIFFKNSPLHDGALLVQRDRLSAAQCILPVSENPNIPKRLGLRHRAALGVTEQTDALVIVVSEETGAISLVEHGEIQEGFSAQDLARALEARLLTPNDAKE